MSHVPSPRIAARPRNTAQQFSAWHRSPNFWPLLGIAFVILLGNALYLLHILNPNPINTLSALQSSVTKGPSSGLYYVDPNVGFTSQALGHRAALSWLHFQVPWWNPYEGVGTPMVGEMQSAAFFPPTLLLGFSTGLLYFHVLLELTAGIGTYYLCRKLRISRVASAVAGAAFGLNGTFAWIFHSPGNPIAFLPLLVLGVEVCHEQPRRWQGPAIIAVSLAMSLYAGSPETAFIDGLVAAVWVAVRAVYLRRSNWRGFVLRIGAGIGTGLLLSAPILVAFADYLRQADIGGHGSLFAHYTEPSSSLPPFLIPYVYGPIFAYYNQNPLGPLTVFWDSAGGYFTPVLCALAIVGCFGRRERPLRFALAAWVLAGMARTFGIPPFLALFNLVPGVKTTAFFRYAPASWELCVIVLAAFGLDEIIQGRNRGRFVVASSAVLLAVLYAYRAAQPALRSASGAQHSRLSMVCAAWGALVLAASCLAVTLRIHSSRWNRSLRPSILAGMVVLDAVAMFSVPQFAAPSGATLDYGPVAFLRAHLGTSRFFTLGPLAPNYGSYFGLASAAVNDLPTPKLYGRYITRHLNSNASPVTFTGVDERDFSGPSYTEELLTHVEGYRQIGVKYVLAPSGTTLSTAADGSTLVPVYADRTVEIFYLPGSASYFSGRSCTFSHVSWESATAFCTSPTAVTRRELYMPGWTASANGRQVSVKKVDNLFQQVVLPQGPSKVVFRFLPPHMDLGFVAFWLGVLVLLFPVVGSARRARIQSRGARLPRRRPMLSAAAIADGTLSAVRSR